jgi:hypothetical protein
MQGCCSYVVVFARDQCWLMHARRRVFFCFGRHTGYGGYGKWYAAVSLGCLYSMPAIWRYKANQLMQMQLLGTCLPKVAVMGEGGVLAVIALVTLLPFTQGERGAGLWVSGRRQHADPILCADGGRPDGARRLHHPVPHGCAPVCLRFPWTRTCLPKVSVRFRHEFPWAVLVIRTVL